MIQSPMSLTGGTKRVVRLMSLQFSSISNPTVRSLVKALWWIFAACVVGIWVLFLLCWNVLAWTLFLVPTLIIRSFGRSKRKRKVQAAQHREMMSAIANQAQAPTPVPPAPPIE